MTTTTREPFWSMVARLRDFEGHRCLWRVPLAGLLFALPAFPLVGAGVLASYIVRDGFGLGKAVAAAVVGAGAAMILTPRIAGWRLGRRIVADRLWSFEKPNPATEVAVLIRSSEEMAARFALRRAKLNPQLWGLLIPQPPPDATELDFQIRVEEPAAWSKSVSDEDRRNRIAGVLSQAGIRARVGGLDTFPGGALEPAFGRKP